MPRLDPEVFAYHRRQAEALRRAAISQAFGSARGRLRHSVVRLLKSFVAPGATSLRASR